MRAALHWSRSTAPILRRQQAPQSFPGSAGVVFLSKTRKAVTIEANQSHLGSQPDKSIFRLHAAPARFLRQPVLHAPCLASVAGQRSGSSSAMPIGAKHNSIEAPTTTHLNLAENGIRPPAVLAGPSSARSNWRDFGPLMGVERASKQSVPRTIGAPVRSMRRAKAADQCIQSTAQRPRPLSTH